MTTKAERRAAAQASINDQFGDVQPAHRPSPWQYQAWEHDVAWHERCDDDGWWEGLCPISTNRAHPARFNFAKDVMQCNEPDAGGGPSCHPGKHMMSLSNAMLKRHG